jgi:peroxiredoxin
MKAWVASALTVTLASASGSYAQTQPSSPLDATLRNASGDKAPLSKWRGKPVILFYEDKDSTTLNLAFKDQLFAVGKQKGLLDAVSVVAVAHLKPFNFFPARQIALSYVRDEEKKVGVPILVDLDGTLGGPPWNLPTRTSTVMLLDASGAVVYRYSGRMGEPDKQAFFSALSQVIGVDFVPQEPQP